MNPSKLATDILKQIQEEHITPRSKAYFWAKNIGFWSLFTLSLLVGAASVALILYAFNNTDYAVGEFVEDSEWFEQLLSLLPLIWILLVGVAIGIGIVGLKHTKRGYRIALFTLVGCNVVGSLVLGSGLYASGGGEILEDLMDEYVEPYEGVREKHQRFWGHPAETGRLAGRITSIDKTNQLLTLEGPFGQEWTVPYDPEKLPPNATLAVGEIFKMRGEIHDDGAFRPKAMKPAQRMEDLHKRVRKHLEAHPELRREARAHLSEETKAQMDAYRKNGELPPPEFRDKVKAEFQENTTQSEREALREEFKRGFIRELPPELKQNLENRPTRGLPSTNLLD